MSCSAMRLALPVGTSPRACRSREKIVPPRRCGSYGRKPGWWRTWVCCGRLDGTATVPARTLCCSPGAAPPCRCRARSHARRGSCCGAGKCRSLTGLPAPTGLKPGQCWANRCVPCCNGWQMAARGVTRRHSGRLPCPGWPPRRVRPRPVGLTSPCRVAIRRDPAGLEGDLGTHAAASDAGSRRAAGTLQSRSSDWEQWCGEDARKRKEPERCGLTVNLRPPLQWKWCAGHEGRRGKGR